MQPKRRMLTASRLCLLGIAVSASRFSVFGQCPNDPNCNAVVGTIRAVTNNSDYGVYGGTAAGTAAGFPCAGVWGGGNAIGVEGYSRYGNGVHGRSYSPSENHRLKGGGCSNGL